MRSMKLFVGGITGELDGCLQLWLNETQLSKDMEVGQILLPPNPFILYAAGIPIIWFWYDKEDGELPVVFNKEHFIEFKITEQILREFLDRHGK